MKLNIFLLTCALASNAIAQTRLPVLVTTNAVLVSPTPARFVASNSLVQLVDGVYSIVDDTNLDGVVSQKNFVFSGVIQSQYNGDVGNRFNLDSDGNLGAATIGSVDAYWNITHDGAANFNGTVTASNFVGIGSGLTGITAAQVGAVPTNSQRFLTTVTNSQLLSTNMVPGLLPTLSVGNASGLTNIPPTPSGWSTIVSLGGTAYYFPFWSAYNIYYASATGTGTPAPRNMTISGLQAYIRQASLAVTTNIVVTLYTNGAATAITETVTASQTPVATNTASLYITNGTILAWKIAVNGNTSGNSDVILSFLLQ